MPRILYPAVTKSSRHATTDEAESWIGRNKRRVHQKVRTGCHACKVRHQKCDEQKPTCSGCTRHDTGCQYPARKYSRKEPSPPVLSPSSASSPNLPTADNKIRDGRIIRSPPSDLNLCDLELLHQYVTSTCVATAQRPEVTAHIQATAPRLGLEYPFVMRGILAMAATHLSHLRPQRRRHYAMLAAKNHDAALPEYRTSLQNFGQDNHQALIAYSKSLLWCSYAGLESLDGGLLGGTQRESVPPQEDSHYWELPSWFLLLRGSCLVVESSRSWIRDGPHALLPETPPPPKGEDDSTNCNNIDTQEDDRQLLHLSLDLEERLHHLQIPEDKLSLCKSSLQDLRIAFTLASMAHQNTPLRNAMNYWMGRVTDEFLASFRNKESWALVVLAHFCVLVHRSERVWFMQGKARGLLLSIIGAVDDDWKRHVVWPCQEIFKE